MDNFRKIRLPILEQMLASKSIGEIALYEESMDLPEECTRYKEQKYGLVLTSTGNPAPCYHRFKSEHLYIPD